MTRDLPRRVRLVDVGHDELLAVGADPHPFADQRVRTG